MCFSLPTCQTNLPVLSLFPQLWVLFLLPGTRQCLLRRHVMLCIPKQGLKSSLLCISQIAPFFLMASLKPVSSRSPGPQPREAGTGPREIAVASSFCLRISRAEGAHQGRHRLR